MLVVDSLYMATCQTSGVLYKPEQFIGLFSDTNLR
jgi:hypothetical protein